MIFVEDQDSDLDALTLPPSSPALRASLAAVNDLADTLSFSAEEMAATCADMRTSAAATAEQVTGAAGAARQVSAEAGRVEEGMRDVRASAELIDQQTRAALTKVSHGVTVANGSKASVDELCAASRDIAQIVKLIGKISQQVKLLALNASIEAARAGQAGLGFGVVAAEVRELAKQTEAASTQIEKRVSAINRSTTAVSGDIAQIADAIGSVAAAQDAISAAVREQTAATSVVASAAARAARAAESIAQRLESADQMAQQGRNGAEALENAARGLAESTAQLKVVIEESKGALGAG